MYNRCGKHYYIVINGCKAFKANMCWLISNQPSITKTKHLSSMHEPFLIRRFCEWRRRENRWQIVSALCLVVKRVFNRNWLKVFRCKLVLPKWCWIHYINCVTRGIQHITEIESKNSFELFYEGPWAVEVDKKSKTFPVTWQYTCLQVSV